MRRLAAAAAAAAGLGAALAAGHAAAAPTPASLTVNAAPGRAAQVAQGLAKGGLRVQRRDGRRFQVVAAPARADALARLPGVAGARELTTAFGDDVQVSQGLERQGADVLGKVADGGAGLTIAVLDLGFGQNLARLQTLGEIPAPGRSRRCRSTRRTASPAGTPTATAPTTARSSPRPSSTTRRRPATCS